MRGQRSARIVLGCAMLGIATTVATAWGLARWGHVGGAAYSMTTMVDAEGGVWMYAEESGFGTRRIRSLPFDVRFDAVRSAGFEPGPAIVEREGPRRRRRLSEEGVSGNDLPRHGWVDDASGWPMIALAYETRTVSPTYMGPSKIEAVRWGALMTGLGVRRTGRPRMWALPLRPVWPGFVVNTGVFGMGWFLCVVGVTRLATSARTRRRKRRGLCARCGYDLSGQVHDGCPECGLGRGSKG